MELLKKDKRTLMLEEDIRDLFEKVRVEREADRYLTDGIPMLGTNLKEYKKLIDTLIRFIDTYCRWDNTNGNTFRDYMHKSLDDECDKIHVVMQNKNNSYEIYRAASYVYNLLLNVLSEHQW